MHRKEKEETDGSNGEEDDDHVFSLKIQSDNNARLHRLLDYNSALE